MGVLSVEAKSDIEKAKEDFGAIVLPGESLDDLPVGIRDPELVRELRFELRRKFEGQGMVRFCNGGLIYNFADRLPLAAHLSGEELERVEKLIACVNGWRIANMIEEDIRFH